MNYAMFTKAGNARVATIVKRAKAKDWNWERTYAALEKLSENKKYGEATDTAVREVVYDACGFDTDFYI